MTDEEIVALLSEGMRAEGTGDGHRAAECWNQAWAAAEGSYQRGMAAHYVARTYMDDHRERLGWNRICLEEFLRVEAERDIAGYFASAYASIGSCHLELGELGPASHYYRLARDKLADVKPGPYRDGVAAGIHRSLERLAVLQGGERLSAAEQGERLITERCVLRPIQPADIDFLVCLRTDPEVRTFLGGPLAEYEARRRATSEIGAPKAFLVESRLTCAPIGLVDISDHGHGGPEVSYAFVPSAWGQGLGSESVGAVAAWFHGQHPDVRLLAVTQTANRRSCLLLEGLGARGVAEVEEFGEAQTVYQLG